MKITVEGVVIGSDQLATPLILFAPALMASGYDVIKGILFTSTSVSTTKGIVKETGTVTKTPTVKSLTTLKTPQNVIKTVGAVSAAKTSGDVVESLTSQQSYVSNIEDSDVILNNPSNVVSGDAVGSINETTDEVSDIITAPVDIGSASGKVSSPVIGSVSGVQQWRTVFDHTVPIEKMEVVSSVGKSESVINSVTPPNKMSAVTSVNTTISAVLDEATDIMTETTSFYEINIAQTSEVSNGETTVTVPDYNKANSGSENGISSAVLEKRTKEMVSGVTTSSAMLVSGVNSEPVSAVTGIGETKIEAVTAIKQTSGYLLRDLSSTNKQVIEDFSVLVKNVNEVTGNTKKNVLTAVTPVNKQVIESLDLTPTTVKRIDVNSKKLLEYFDGNVLTPVLKDVNVSKALDVETTVIGDVDVTPDMEDIVKDVTTNEREVITAVDFDGGNNAEVNYKFGNNNVALYGEGYKRFLNILFGEQRVIGNIVFRIDAPSGFAFTDIFAKDGYIIESDGTRTEQTNFQPIDDLHPEQKKRNIIELSIGNILLNSYKALVFNVLPGATVKYKISFEVF